MLICLAEINCPFGILRLISYLYSCKGLKQIKKTSSTWVMFLYCFYLILVCILTIFCNASVKYYSSRIGSCLKKRQNKLILLTYILIIEPLTVILQHFKTIQ